MKSLITDVHAGGGETAIDVEHGAGDVNRFRRAEATASATSDGSATRPMGYQRAPACGRPQVGCWAQFPGDIAGAHQAGADGVTQRMPMGPYSLAIDWVRLMMPALAAL